MFWGVAELAYAAGLNPAAERLEGSNPSTPTTFCRGVMELVYIADSKSAAAKHVGSNPTAPTIS